MNLSGKWNLAKSFLPQRPNFDESWEVNVPEEIHLSLHRLGLAPEPFIEENYLALIEWEKRDFWLQKKFLYRAKNKNPQWLVFEGIDCRSVIYLNGAELGRFDGMFAGPEFNITSKLREGENELVVHILPSETEPDKALDQYQKGISFQQDYVAGARYLKPAQLMGSNGFPRLVTAGIWLPVFIQEREPAAISDLWVETDSAKVEQSTVIVHYETFSKKERRDLQLKFFDSKNRPTKTARTTRSKKGWKVTLPKAALWWPNGHGEQPLYRCEVVDRSGAVLKSTRFGIREIRWVKNTGTDHELTMEVNGIKIYARGANLAGDKLLRHDISRYEWHLRLMKEANMNCIRWWSGQGREATAFYDLCDEYGIMIHHDFRVCNVTDATRVDLKIYDLQMTALVKALRGHCSIISWMAGNELFNAEIQGTPLRALALRGEKLAKALNPKRRYFISSYALGDGLTDEYDHWGRRTSLPSSFENALQGTPKMSVEMSISHTVFTGMPWRQFERLFPKWSKQWPPEKKIHMNRINNADWNQEFYCDSFGVQKIDPQTAAPFENWKDLLYYSSCYSGFSMATLIMNWRAHLFYNSGALPWCWHDQCPMVGMGMIDGYEAPKALYYFVKRAYLPQFMTMKYEAKQFDVRERLRSWIRIINEAGKTMKGHRPELFWYDSKFNLQLKIDSQKPFGLHGVNPIHQSGDHVAMRLSNQSVASGTWEEVGDLNGLGYLFPWYKLLGHPWVQDESPQLPDKSFFGIVLRLSDQQGRLVSQDFYPFNFDWYPSETVQQLPQARLVLESLRKTARGYSIAIKNDSKALFPWIELEALDFNLQDYHLSDNYFTLMPNEKRTLELILRNPKQKLPAALEFQYRGLNGFGHLRNK